MSELENRIRELAGQIIQESGAIWKDNVDKDFVEGIARDIAVQEAKYLTATDPAKKQEYITNLENLKAQVAGRAALIKNKLAGSGVKIVEKVIISIIVEVIKKAVGL